MGKAGLTQNLAIIILNHPQKRAIKNRENSKDRIAKKVEGNDRT